jgi:hypothetical protein
LNATSFDQLKKTIKGNNACIQEAIQFWMALVLDPSTDPAASASETIAYVDSLFAKGICNPFE